MGVLKRGVLGAALFVAAAWAAHAGHLYFTQDSRIFFPTREYAATPADRGIPYEEVRFSAPGGPVLTSWWSPVESPKGVILYFHGNARNVSGDVGVLEMFREFGYSALFVDYRGYGKSEGKPSEKGTYEDALAAWEWLKKRGIAPRDVVVWGRSLGAGVAVNLAVTADEAPRALVTEAAFTSIAEMAELMHRGVPVRIFLRTHYDNLKKIGKARCPVLVVHSREDELVPLAMGKRLFEAAPEPKRFLEIKGPHKGLDWQPGYEEGLQAFLEWARAR